MQLLKYRRCQNDEEKAKFRFIHKACNSDWVRILMVFFGVSIILIDLVINKPVNGNAYKWS